MGCFKAYDKDNNEKEFTTLDYYEYIVNEYINEINEQDISYSLIKNYFETSNFNISDFNKIQKEYLKYLITFWKEEETKEKYEILSNKNISDDDLFNRLKKIKNIDCFKIVKQEGDLLVNLIYFLNMTESKNKWKSNEDTPYKIIFISTIYKSFFMDYDSTKKVNACVKKSDKKTRRDRQLMSLFPWSADKFDNKQDCEHNNNESYSPEVSPPVFVLEDVNNFYILVNEKAPLLFTEENSTDSSKRHYFFCEKSELKTYSTSFKMKGFNPSSYVGRADPMSEIDYMWKFQNDENNEKEKGILKSIAYLIGLDSDKQTSDDDKSLESKGYHKTNSYINKTNLNKHDKLESFMNNGITIFIKYEENIQNKRNFPKKDVPPPKSYSFADLTNDEFKIDSYDRKYRTKKKGETLTISNKNRKSDKGQNYIMANTLKDSFFYDYLISKYEKTDDTKDEPKKTKVTNSSLPATSFAQACLDYNKEGNRILEKWKEDKENDKIRTNQEWCHLFGYGDGGKNEYENLVSGSKHCNTEQLAIETGQRKVTSKYENIKSNITAYLYPNEGTYKKLSVKEFEELKGKYPSLDESHFSSFFNKKNDVYEVNINELHNNKDDLSTLKKDIIEKYFRLLPLARVMRYKHYVKDKKVFDHVYDAQREGISVIECKLLDYIVEWNLYKALGEENKYKEVLLNRLKAKSPSQETLQMYEKIISDSDAQRIATLNIKRKGEDLSDLYEKIKEKIKENSEKISPDENQLKKLKKEIYLKDTVDSIDEEEE
ncbi:hypothetical protein ACOJTA_09565 [Malaciobacter sp. WC5094]